MFGHIEGKVYGDWTWIGDKNRALLALLLAQQARETLDLVEAERIKQRHPMLAPEMVSQLPRKIIIFSGRKLGREYMGWRTGRDETLNVVEEAIV